MHARFLNMTIKKQQTDENARHFLNMRYAGQEVKMLCSTTQSGTSDHPRPHALPHVFLLF